NDQVGLAELPGLLALHPRDMTARAHIPSFTLDIRKRRVICVTQDRIDLSEQPSGHRLTPPVPLIPGPLRRSTQAGVEDRDVLRPGDRQIEVQRRLPGLPLRLDPQHRPPVIIGARLGGQQALVDLHGLPGVRRCTPELRPVWPFSLTEQQVVRLPLNLLARGETQPFGAWSPPGSRRLARLRSREI